MFELGPCSEIISRYKNALELEVNLSFISMSIEYFSVVVDRETKFSSSGVLHNYQAGTHYSFDESTSI